MKRWMFEMMLCPADAIKLEEGGLRLFLETALQSQGRLPVGCHPAVIETQSISGVMDAQGRSRHQIEYVLMDLHGRFVNELPTEETHGQ